MPFVGLLSRRATRRRVALLACASVLMLGTVIAPQRAGAASLTLTGAGSTFDNPFFAKAFYSYSKANPGVLINYQPIGSGGGIQQFTKGTVDFGATDVPMNAAELKAAQAAGGPVLQIPIALGATALAYNIPGVTGGLKLTPAAIAGIFLGKITSWDDPAITGQNPGVTLPKLAITTVHRSDGSGTTYIFTDYLARISSDWNSNVGTGKSVQWPGGVGGKGTAGVAAEVKNISGAIGYVELAYALQNHMGFARVRNSAGTFVTPSLETTRNAAATVPNVTPTHFSIVNASGAQSYPIAGYSWVLLYEKPKDASRSQALVKVMTWMVTTGQVYASELDYVPLPASIRSVDQAELSRVG